MKIIIAEDDPIAAAILDRTLLSYGHDVRLRADGQEAWEAFQREPAQLVISDWMMPRMDGMQLCEKIRQQGGNFYNYFILLTSRETSGDNHDLAIATGVDDFLAKPLDRQTIKMRVRAAERIVRFTHEMRKLKEVIPICSWCRKVRNDSDYWQQVEAYIVEQTGSAFTHGVCPECREIVMAQC